jgi:hypothetical protein
MSYNVHGSDEESLRTALGFKVNYEWKVGKILIKPGAARGVAA